jgi:Iap family predicted aminopeptidase
VEFQQLVIFHRMEQTQVLEQLKLLAAEPEAHGTVMRLRKVARMVRQGDLRAVMRMTPQVLQARPVQEL